MEIFPGFSIEDHIEPANGAITRSVRVDDVHLVVKLTDEGIIIDRYDSNDGFAEPTTFGQTYEEIAENFPSW